MASEKSIRERYLSSINEQSMLSNTYDVKGGSWFNNSMER
jgi:hypothetical protein